MVLLLAQQFVVEGPPMVLKVIGDAAFYQSPEFWIHTVLDLAVAGGTIGLAWVTWSLVQRTTDLANDARLAREDAARQLAQDDLHHRQQLSGAVVMDNMTVTVVQRESVPGRYRITIQFRGSLKNMGFGPALTPTAALRLSSRPDMSEMLAQLPSLKAGEVIEDGQTRHWVYESFVDTDQPFHTGGIIGPSQVPPTAVITYYNVFHDEQQTVYDYTNVTEVAASNWIFTWIQRPLNLNEPIPPEGPSIVTGPVRRVQR